MFEFTAVDGEAVCSAKERELKLAMEKAGAIFFPTLKEEADPREVIDFVATELRDKMHLQGELQLHLQGEPGVIEASMMWVDPTGPTGDCKWLACFLLPKSWKLKLPVGHKARQLGNVKVVEFDGMFDVWAFGSKVSWCEVDLSRPTQRELDRRELYEALHLE
jgi:hypothetical protein